MDSKISLFFDLKKFHHRELFEKCAYPWEALNFLEDYLRKLLSLKPRESYNLSPQAYLINPDEIHIGADSIVEAGAYIEGPCWIGKNCVIRHGAYIRGNLLMDDHSVIGHDTEVKNAIFFTHAHAAHFAYVGDSILGNKVNLGAGTKCANFRLDKQSIAVNFDGIRLETHRRKFGGIIGDNCQIGCNSVLNPGTLIGKDVKCYPCVNIGGWIPERSLVKPAHKTVVVPLNIKD